MSLSAYCTLLLENGETRRVDSLQSGDALRDPVAGGTAAVKDVWQGPAVGMFRIAAANGAVLDLTGDHAIQTASGPMQADHIRPGTQLLTGSGLSPCAEASPLPGDFMVYDLALPRAACVLANGIAVLA